MESIIGDLNPDWSLIQFMGIYFHNKRYYFGSIRAPEYYDELEKRVEPLIYNNPGEMKNVNIHVQQKSLTVIVCPITDFGTGKIIYQLVIALNVNKFSKLLTAGNLGKTGKLFLMNKNMDLIYPEVSSENQDEWENVRNSIMENQNSIVLPKNILIPKNGEQKIVSMKTDFDSWYIIGYISTNEIVGRIFDWKTFLLIPSISILIGILFSVYITKRIIKPFNNIKNALQKVEQEQYNFTLNDFSFKETQYICNQFNATAKHLNRLITEIHVAELERKDALYASLQAQIRPHFIYNTLENINMMLITRNQFDISEYITIFGNILRYNIDPKKNKVTLEEDLNQVEAYLQIQKMRFGSRLNYSVDIQNESRKIPIEKLLIQPIVENAVIHGISPAAEGGEIRISSRIDNDLLLIEIIDNGVGFSSQKIQSFLEEDHSRSPQDGGHIGLRNVNSRIKHSYGKEYGLKIISNPLRTAVIIQLPAKEENSVHA